MNDEDFFNCMGERGVASIMLALRDADGPLIFKDLSPIIRNSQSLRRTLDDMEEDGMIDMTVVLTGHKSISVSLTDAGRDVSLLLRVASNLAPGGSLDMRHADPILRILRGKEYVVQKDILERISSYVSVRDVLDSMERDGLIVHTVKTEWPKEDRYSLTVLGEQIAVIYQAIWEKIDSVRIKGRVGRSDSRTPWVSGGSYEVPDMRSRIRSEPLLHLPGMREHTRPRRRELRGL